MKQSNQIDEKIIDKIISVAYGSAGIVDRIKVYFYSLRNPEIKKLLNEYKQTADAIHSYRDIKCPENIINSSLQKISKENKQRKLLIFELLLRKPIITVASVIVIAAFIAIFITRKPQVERTYSKAEVEIAEKQVKQSLALVGKIFRSTGNTLSQDIIEKQVVPPFHKSLETVNYLFKGG